MNSKTELLTPDIEWKQSQSLVLLTINLENVQHPLIKIENDEIYFKGVGGKETKLYELKIRLSRRIIKENSRFNVEKVLVAFLLVKEQEEFWYCLTNDGNYKYIPNIQDIHEIHTFTKKIIEGNLPKESNQEEVSRNEQKEKRIQALEANITQKDRELKELEKNMKEKDKRLTAIEEALKDIIVKGNFENLISSPQQKSALQSKSYSARVCENAALLVPADKPATFKIVIDDKDVLLRNVRASITTPSNKKKIGDVISETAPGSFGIRFIPREVGTHTLEVYVAGMSCLVFEADVYDTKLIEIEEVEFGILGEPVEFEVNTTKAGKGTLSLLVKATLLNERCASRLQKVEDGKYRASFTPKELGIHMVWLSFNRKLLKITKGDMKDVDFDEEYDDPTFVCLVREFPSGIRLLQVESELIPVQEVFTFMIEICEIPLVLHILDIKTKVVGPSGPVPTWRIPLSRCLFVEHFVPNESGTFEISVKVYGKHVMGSPFKVKAFHNFKEGLTGATLFLAKSFNYRGKNQLCNLEQIPVNKASVFAIECEGAEGNKGSFTITVTIEGPNGEIPIKMTAYSSGFLVEFTPTAVGNHTIKVLWNGALVKGTPFTTNVVENLQEKAVTKKGKKNKKKH